MAIGIALESGLDMFGKQRSASYPPAPSGTVVYVVSDVHGRADLLADIHRLIDVDHRRAGVQKHEIYLGDYIDRGPETRAVVDRLLDRAKFHSTLFIRGNHEAMLARFLSGELRWATWRAAGGAETVRSYGLEVCASSSVDEDALRNTLAARMPAEHHAFFGGLGACCEYGEYFFTHAGVRPDVRLDEQSAEDLMWIRSDFLRHTGSFGKIIVHGHTAVQKPSFLPNRINIDTMAHSSGVLTCLRIDADGASAFSSGRGLIGRAMAWPRFLSRDDGSVLARRQA